MTHAEQRKADEARGRLCRQLEEKAAEHGLIVDRSRYPSSGTWHVSLIPIDPDVDVIRAKGDSEAEAIDKVLDQLNRMEVAS